MEKATQEDQKRGRMGGEGGGGGWCKITSRPLVNPGQLKYEGHISDSQRWSRSSVPQTEHKEAYSRT